MDADGVSGDEADRGQPQPAPGMRNGVTGYVLAGGRSLRMGRDKAFVIAGEVTLLASALRRLRTVCSDVAILSGPAYVDRDRTLALHARLVPDRAIGWQGPLAGVAAALLDCETEHALLLAVDQPAVSAEMLAALAAAGQRGGLLVQFSAADGSAEPLPCLLARSLRDHVMHLLGNGERRLAVGLTLAVQQAGGSMTMLAPSAAERRFLANLNTPTDLEEWLRLTSASNPSAPGASE